MWDRNPSLASHGFPGDTHGDPEGRDFPIYKTRPNSALDMRRQNTDCILTYLLGSLCKLIEPPHTLANEF